MAGYYDLEGGIRYALYEKRYGYMVEWVYYLKDSYVWVI